MISQYRYKTKNKGIVSRQPLKHSFHPSKHSPTGQSHLLLTAHRRPRPIRTANNRSHSFSRAHGSCAALLLNGCATGVRGSAFARAQEDGCGVGCGDEPEQRIDEVNPDSVFHADDATLFGCRSCFHEDLAEDSEECKPEDATGRCQSFATAVVSSDRLTTRSSPRQNPSTT
jgi:hypothetical protein